jgi:hypothetical protein
VAIEHEGSGVRDTSARDQEFAEDFAAFLMTEMMCGATTKQAVASTFGHFYKDGKPYHPPRKGLRLYWYQWAPLRDEIFDRDGLQCTYCGDEEGPLEIDHIVPVTRGGTNDHANLCVACRRCNISKSNLLLSEWRCEA